MMNWNQNRRQGVRSTQGCNHLVKMSIRDRSCINSRSMRKARTVCRSNDTKTKKKTSRREKKEKEEKKKPNTRCIRGAGNAVW